MPVRVRLLKNLLLAGLAFAPIPGIALAGSYSERVLYSFQGGQDGMHPISTPINVDGILYGTTAAGGGSCDCGTIYSLTPDGTETILYRFAGGSDGLEPRGGLLDVGGVLYGTTYSGGKYNEGTIYRLLRNGTEQVIHSFGGAPNDGEGPNAALIYANGVLYGTTELGGLNKDGTVFSFTLSGAETVIHSFIAAEGKSPTAALLEVDGLLYGTAASGGSDHDGTVFSLTPGGEFQVLHSFGTTRGDGSGPSAALIDLDGVLYSTTELGGSKKLGTVFSITPSGTESVIYSFSATGGEASSSLLAVNGVLVSATEANEYVDGNIFAVTTAGSESVLFAFSGPDGSDPLSGLVRMGNQLYGTTYQGGTAGLGTVYAFSH